jgi:hypothetical protein
MNNISNQSRDYLFYAKAELGAGEYTPVGIDDLTKMTKILQQKRIKQIAVRAVTLGIATPFQKKLVKPERLEERVGELNYHCKKITAATVIQMRFKESLSRKVHCTPWICTTKE